MLVGTIDRRYGYVIYRLGTMVAIIAALLTAVPTAAQEPNVPLIVRLKFLEVRALAPFNNPERAQFYPIVKDLGFPPQGAGGEHLARTQGALIRPNWTFEERISLPRHPDYGSVINLSIRNKTGEYCILFWCQHAVDINPVPKVTWEVFMRSAGIVYHPSSCTIGTGQAGGWLNPNHCVIIAQTEGTDDMRARILFSLDLIWQSSFAMDGDMPT